MKANLSAVSPSRGEYSIARAANRRYAPSISVHKTAVAALLDVCIELEGGLPGAERAFDRSEVLALFRVAIKEQNATQQNPHREETAILETALTLLENAKVGNALLAQEFFEALAFGWLAEWTFRVKYDPETVITVN